MVCYAVIRDVCRVEFVFDDLLLMYCYVLL